ncbi:MAG: VCBS repeat-containing protein, partial [Deltaproteobacteria bacterium]
MSRRRAGMSRDAMFAAALLAGVLSAPRPGLADWPMARREPGRNATASGPSDLATPAIAWREYLGGALASDQQVAADLNADGSSDVVFISGGRLVAKRADDSLIWQTPPYDLQRIDAIRDIDGDHTVDVIAHGFPGRVMILSGRDGHLEWRTANPPFGPTIGAVRFADLDRDGHDDLYVADNACGSADSEGDVVIAYTFAHGFGVGSDNGDQRIWTTPFGMLERGREYNCGSNDVVADLNNDGIPEVITFATRYLYLYDGRTGSKIRCPGSADPQGGFPLGFSLPYGQVVTDVVDVDHDGSLDIVGYSNNGYDPSINSRALFVVSYDLSRPAGTRLWVRWHRSVADVGTDTHPFNQRGAADFDGDGRVEVATTMVEGGVTTTHVFDGGTGAQLATLPGATINAVVVLAPGQLPTLIVRHGAVLEGYRFASFGGGDGGTGAPPRVFAIPAGGVLQYYDRSYAVRSSATSTPLTFAVHGGTRQGLLLNRNNAIELWDVGASPAPTEPLASLSFGADLSVLSVAPQTGVFLPGPGLLFARSDGYLLVLDDQLHVINFGGVETTLPGIRMGGYYSGSSGLGAVPIAARFPDARDGSPDHDEVLATTSRGRLTRFDVSHASLLAPPTNRWEWQGASSPVAVDVNGDGLTDEIAALVGNSLVARRPDGVTPIFSFLVTDPAHPLEQATRQFSVSRNHGAVEFAVIDVDVGIGTGYLVRLDNAGVQRWRSAPILWAGSGYGYPSADDLDGDGVDENLFMIAGQLRAYSGTDGALLASGIPTYSSIPMTVRGLAGAGTVTHLAGGSVTALQGIHVSSTPTSTTLTRVWSLDAAFHHASRAAAVLQCSATHLVTAIAEYSLPDLIVADAATGTHPLTAGAPAAQLFLAGGRAFDDVPSMVASGANGGLLGNVVATPALYAGRPAFLVPSTDGYLYAIDPCGAAPRVLWALNFRAPVGEPIFADTDGDGSDEVVLEAADGFLYGIDTAHLPTPEWVHDVDPGGPSTDDLNDTYGTAIEAAWA